MKKITIGLFVDTFFPMIDGVATVVDNYAKRLIQYANVIVFAPHYPDSNDIDLKCQYKIVRCKSLKLYVVDYSLPIPKLDRKFKNELENIKLDIVHIHSPFMIGKLGIDYAKKHNIPVIATMHSQYKQDFLRSFKSKTLANLLTKMVVKQYNRCDQCYAVNSEIARIYYEEYKTQKLPQVMNNATDMIPVKDVKKASDLVNKKYNIKENEKVFLFVGRLNNLKNIFFLANSLKLLKDKQVFNFKMLFIGTGQDEEKLIQLIKENKMEQDIIIGGKVTDRELLASIYARADLFLFPSLYDASSIVQIEAASQKTPTLFIEGAATSATINNNVNGYLAENDELKYALKIIEIMQDEKSLKKIADNCFKDIYINWDTQIKEIYNLYVGFINNDGIKK